MQKPLDFKHENRVAIPHLHLYKKMALEKLLLGTTITGSRNSRMKDFHDLLLLLRDKSLSNSKTLHENVQKTFENPGTILKPIQFDEAGHKALQQLWTAHIQGLGDVANELDLPESIIAGIDEINSVMKLILK